MADPGGSQVSCMNEGAFDGALSVLWNHNGLQQESEQTDVYSWGLSRTIDLRPYASQNILSTGDSCWLRWHMVGGPNHDSGQNFTFESESNYVVAYTITGGVDNPSFDQQDY